MSKYMALLKAKILYLLLTYTCIRVIFIFVQILQVHVSKWNKWSFERAAVVTYIVKYFTLGRFVLCWAQP